MIPSVNENLFQLQQATCLIQYSSAFNFVIHFKVEGYSVFESFSKSIIHEKKVIKMCQNVYITLRVPLRYQFNHFRSLSTNTSWFGNKCICQRRKIIRTNVIQLKRVRPSLIFRMYLSDMRSDRVIVFKIKIHK